MGRVKDVLYDAEHKAEQAVWESTSERQNTHLAETRRRVEQEREWARAHPTEWAAWLNLQTVWRAVIDFATVGENEYGFEEFLTEVGGAPSGHYRIERIDDSHPYQPGNLEWRRSTTIESPYLTVEEAAAYCRVSVKTIYNHRHEIRSVPGTGKLLFLREELDRWLSTRRKKRATRIAPPTLAGETGPRSGRRDD